MHISYLPPKGYPDQLSITLMDGRSVRLESGRHTYAKDVVERLSQTISINSALKNMISQQIIIIENQKNPGELMPLYAADGTFMGHFPVQQEIKNDYATTIPQVPDTIAPPMQAVMSTMPGYYPIAGAVPGVTGAPSYAPPIDGLNQYTINGQQQAIQNNQVNTVIPIDSTNDIFQYDSLSMTPTGNISAIRANGQVLPEEMNSMPSTPNQAGRQSPFPQPQQQQSPPANYPPQPAPTLQNPLPPAPTPQNPPEPTGISYESVETSVDYATLTDDKPARKTTKKRRVT